MIKVCDHLLGSLLGELDSAIEPCLLKYDVLPDIEEGVKLIHYDAIVVFVILSGVYGSSADSPYIDLL